MLFTGLTVAVAKAESPVVNGYFCLPTQTFDNDGDPHILEHLIFMGSEDYPYKEALDYLANRCLAKRTNAWTSTDHTCYTVYTVGTSGFLQILPIYLDHILFPMLRSEDFVTEVHHINGKGHDAGVVYSEIQGSKYATSSSRALKKKVYPDGSGYYSLTGGKLENMRNTTNIEKVRDYHKKYYRPENLQLTITGRIDEEQLFNVIRPIEEKILNKRAIQPADEYIRPWSQDLKETGYEENFVFEHIFPDEDEDKAHVLISWRLDHHIWEKVPMLEAYELMFKYLTSSKVSPFQKEFVQSEDPLASGVGFFSYKYNLPSVGIKFANVPTNRTKEVIPRMEKVVQQVLEDGPEKFDLVRIHDYIDTGLKKNIKENENGPHTFFPDATLLDKLYGHTAENFEEYVVANQWSSAHRDHDAQYWLNLIDEIFNKHKYIAVEGIPSLALSKNITDTEKERTEKQVESLGEEGLAQKAQELKAAVESQTLPGVEILEKIPLGDVNQIQFRHLESFNRTQNPDNIIDFSAIPMKVHVDDVKSSFVTFYIFIDMVQYNLTQEQRRYLPLFTDMWIRSPMIKNGTITDIDGVIKRYNKVMIKFEMSQTHSYLVMGGQTELGLLEEAIDFVHDRINYPYFTKDDLNKTITKKLNKGTPGASSIKSSLLNGIYYDNNTLEHYSSHWPQKTFLTKLQKKIKDGKAESIIEDLYDMVHVLGVSNNSFLHIAGNVQKMTEQFGSNLSVFSKIFNATETDPKDENLNERYQMKVESDYRDVNKTHPQHVALGVESTSSCYMSQTVMYNNTEWSKPEVCLLLERVTFKFILLPVVGGPHPSYVEVPL